MKLKFIIIPTLLLTFSTASLSQWDIKKSTDEMTDTTTCTMTAMGNNSTDSGRRLYTTLTVGLIKIGGKKFPFVASYFADRSYNSSGMFRVDSKKAIKSDMTQRVEGGGPMHISILKYDTLIKQLKKGMKIKISNGSDIGEISLIGFTKNYNKLMACNN